MLRPTYIKQTHTNVFNINQIITVCYYELYSSYRFEGEIHDFWEAIYADKGELTVTSQNRTYLLKSGEMFFHKPNTFHRFAAAKGSCPNVFVISFDCKSTSMKYFNDRIVTLKSPQKKLVASIIDEAQHLYYPNGIRPPFDLRIKKDAPVGVKQMIRIYLEQLLISLIRSDKGGKKHPSAIYPSKEEMENQLIASVISIMEKNIYGRITVPDICRQVNYKKTFISNAFKNATGSTLMQYYNGLKINEAKRLVRQNGYSFSMISDMLCFDNPQYFSRTFKRIVGMTPREYEKSIMR